MSGTASVATDLRSARTSAPTTSRPSRPRRQARLEWIALHSIGVALGLLFLLPFVFIALTALMSDEQTLTRDLWPQHLGVAQLRHGLADAGLRHLVAQHVIYAVGGTVLTLLSSFPVAYALARFKFRGRSLALGVVDRDDDAAAAGGDRAAVPDVGAAVPPVRHAVAADHPDGVRRRVLDLPAAAVPADDPVGVHRRGPGRRLRRASRRCCTSSSRWPKPAIAAVALFQFFYCWNDYFGPLLYASENPGAWTLSYGLESFQGAHHTDWNLTMAATLLVMAAGDHRVLLRPEGLRRGRHADGGEGMKLAVVGGGSTYTPELDRRVRAAARRARRSRSWCWSTPTPSGSSWSAGWRGGCSRGWAIPATRHDHDRPRRRRSTAPTPCCSSCASAGRRPATSDETWPLDCGCVGQETTGRGRPRQGAAHGAGRARHRRAGARARNPDAWIVDFTNPVGIVTRALLHEGHRAVGLCNVAIGFQRRFAAHARRDARPESSSTTSASTTSPGSARCGSTASTCCPSCSPTHGDDLADDDRAAAPSCSTSSGVVPSYYLRYFYAHDEVVARAARPDRRARPRWRRSSASCSTCTPTRRWTRSRRVLEQRGGAFYSEAAVAAGRRAAAAPGTSRPRRCRSSTSRNDGTLPFLPTTHVDRGARRGSAPRAPQPLPVAPLEPLFAGLVAHVAAYERLGARGRAPRRPRSRSSTPCSRTRWSASSSWPSGSPTGCSPTTATTSRGPDDDAASRDRRVRRARDRRAATARPTSRSSPPTARVLGARRGARASSRTASEPRAAVAGARAAGRRGRRRGRACAAGPARRAGRHVSACLANADLPLEPSRLQRRDRRARLGRHDRRWSTTRSRCCAPASTRPPGVAVVCGAGHQLRRACCRTAARRGSPRVGTISGDWGGGELPGRGSAVVGGARRGRPRRADPPEHRAPGHFGCPRCRRSSRPSTWARSPRERCHELTPVLFDVAERGRPRGPGHRAASGRRDRGPRRLALHRLDLADARVDVMLGGGVFTAGHALLLDAIDACCGLGAPGRWPT